MAPTSSTVSLNKMTEQIKTADIDHDALRAAIENPTGFQPLVDRGELTAPYLAGKSLDEITFSPSADTGVFPQS